MSNELLVVPVQVARLEAELHELEVDTFEIEDILDLEQNAAGLSITNVPSCSSCSSCCS